MSEHPGDPMEAELRVIALEHGAMRLHECHPTLFGEVNLSEEHFDRLEALVQSREDAERLMNHPNCTEARRATLDLRYPRASV